MSFRLDGSLFWRHTKVCLAHWTLELVRNWTVSTYYDCKIGNATILISNFVFFLLCSAVGFDMYSHHKWVNFTLPYSHYCCFLVALIFKNKLKTHLVTKIRDLIFKLYLCVGNCMDSRWLVVHTYTPSSPEDLQVSVGTRQDKKGHLQPVLLANWKIKDDGESVCCLQYSIEMMQDMQEGLADEQNWHLIIYTFLMMT